MEEEIVYTRDFSDCPECYFDLDGEVEHGAEFVTLFYLLELFEKFAFRNKGSFSMYCPRKGVFRLRVDAKYLCFHSNQDISFLAMITSVCRPIQVTVNPKTQNFALLADYYVPMCHLLGLSSEEFLSYNPKNWEDLKDALSLILKKTSTKTRVAEASLQSGDQKKDWIKQPHTKK